VLDECIGLKWPVEEFLTMLLVPGCAIVGGFSTSLGMVYNNVPYTSATDSGGGTAPLGDSKPLTNDKIRIHLSINRLPDLDMQTRVRGTEMNLTSER
jgi:hypothetical protein